MLFYNSDYQGMPSVERKHKMFELKNGYKYSSKEDVYAVGITFLLIIEAVFGRMDNSSDSDGIFDDVKGLVKKMIYPVEYNDAILYNSIIAEAIDSERSLLGSSSRGLTKSQPLPYAPLQFHSKYQNSNNQYDVAEDRVREFLMKRYFDFNKGENDNPLTDKIDDLKTMNQYIEEIAPVILIDDNAVEAFFEECRVRAYNPLFPYYQITSKIEEYKKSGQFSAIFGDPQDNSDKETMTLIFTKAYENTGKNPNKAALNFVDVSERLSKVDLISPIIKERITMKEALKEAGVLLSNHINYQSDDYIEELKPLFEETIKANGFDDDYRNLVYLSPGFISQNSRNKLYICNLLPEAEFDEIKEEINNEGNQDKPSLESGELRELCRGVYRDYHNSFDDIANKHKIQSVPVLESHGSVLLEDGSLPAPRGNFKEEAKSELIKKIRV